MRNAYSRSPFGMGGPGPALRIAGGLSRNWIRRSGRRLYLGQRFLPGRLELVPRPPRRQSGLVGGLEPQVEEEARILDGAREIPIRPQLVRGLVVVLLLDLLLPLLAESR